MNRGLSLLAAAATGAAVSYLFDPQQGRRRRAVLRDKTRSAFAEACAATRAVSTDLRNRSQGVLVALRRSVRTQPVEDQVLTERVRARLGRIVSHPAAIDVYASDGRVTLSGAVLATEAAPLERAVRSVPGVVVVENRLAAHERAADVPGLQGDVHGTEELEGAQDWWSPPRPR